MSRNSESGLLPHGASVDVSGPHDRGVALEGCSDVTLFMCRGFDSAGMIVLLRTAESEHPPQLDPAFGSNEIDCPGFLNLNILRNQRFPGK
jgi:hypothetical protein